MTTITTTEKIVEHFIAASCLPDAYNISNEQERQQEREKERGKRRERERESGE